VPGSIIKRLLSNSAVLFGVIFPLLASAAPEPDTYGEMDSAKFEAAAKTTYSLQKFSDKYRATLELSSDDDVFRPGIIKVYDQKSGAVLIQVQSDEMVLDTNPKTDEVKANVHELPYGEQSVLIYEDFNFDGIKDLALMDGQNSCYHGPSFQVFIGSKDGFTHSDSFTDLAQNYCGMFGVDNKTRQLSVMTKDGCCLHEMATYSIRNGEPYEETHTVIDQTSPSGLIEESHSQNKNGKMVETNRTIWEDDEQRKILLAFKLAPLGKKIVLFTPATSDSVYYAAVDGKSEVSLVYPESDAEQFDYDSAGHVLSFVRGDTTYRILGDSQGAPNSMQVVIRGKVTELKLLPEPAQGSLDDVAAALKAVAQ
jgi:hypothetical protein